MSGNSSRTRRRPELTFDRLLGIIQETHQHLVGQAIQAIHANLTLRNWLIGYQIENYRRLGADYFRYHDHLIDELATALRRYGLARCDRRELYRYRQFYLAYPRIAEAAALVWPSVQPIAKLAATAVASPLASQPTGKMLVEQLSFAHLAELMEIDPPRKRAFYERECLRGRWSARTLKRKIAGLHYELSDLAEQRPEDAERAPVVAAAVFPLTVRDDPSVFEFLGLKPREVAEKTDREEHLLDALEAFLLDLNYGLCFETRQKYILIGEEHCFVDLVFYHRILKCHVLVELQPAEFGHENIAQLDACVTWYRDGVMAGDDHQPVGILIHVRQRQAKVEYALAGLDRRLFASQYQPALPGDRELQRFVEQVLTPLDSA